MNYPAEAWRATFEVYLTGFLFPLQHALRLLPRGGHVIAISSAITRFAATNLPGGFWAGHYAAAKAALDELCKWARREAHQRGLMLSRIAPAALDTDFHRSAPAFRRPSAVIPSKLSLA